MKRFIVVLIVMAGLIASAQMGMKATVRYAHLSGMDGLSGTAAIITWESGEHEVFLRVEGLKPNSGVYANHIHFNAAGAANCAAQNGDQIVGLSNLEANADGIAWAYTKLPADVSYPSGSSYVNVHSNDPEPVGASITCGDVAMP
jgi:Cu-Zn family superoxide dismutase